VRVYLPATLPLIEQWLASGAASPADAGPGALAYAVTPSLRESYAEADIDELEYAAQRAAATGSLGLLAADQAATRRRVVLAVDVPDALVSPDSLHGRATVRLVGPTPVSHWASAFIDGPDAELVVAAAVGALGAAAAGDDDAQFALDEVQAHELGWYAVQELRHQLP
jgi:uncharacterized protein DUF6912